MGSVFVPVPPFPNVPMLPGVPQLVRDITQVVNDVLIVTADVKIAEQLFNQKPQWGIFDQHNEPVLVGDSTAEFDYRRDFLVSDYPIEGGKFGSYNKVAEPYGARFTIMKGGTDADRRDFLQLLDALVADTNLYNVVTPEITYLNANIIHIDYSRRSNRGATLLAAGVWLEEIRVTAPATFTNTKSPTDQSVQQDGTVQPADLPAGVDITST